MKKILYSILVCTLMVSSVLASATFVNNNENENNDPVLFEIEDGIISTSMNFGSYEILNSDEGDEIAVEDFGHRLISGMPNLPSKIFSIAIPPGAEFTGLSYEILDSDLVSGFYEVKPVPVPLPMGEIDEETQAKEKAKYDENYKTTYGSDDPYPSENIQLVQTGGFRKYNLVDVRVMPITYHPVSGQLIYHSSISIDVSYTFPEGFNYNEIMIDDIESVEKIAEDTIYNYQQAKDWYPTGPSGRETYDFVIITLDSLEDDVKELVEWEEAKGKDVFVATTDWIDDEYDGYDLAAKMRNFLRDKYPSQSWGILDVCLVGDYDSVPMRYTAQGCDTDFYYAELTKTDEESWDDDGDHYYGESGDPIDFHSEINVGRIPWDDGGIVQDICEKTKAYEQTNDPSYKKNVLLIGTFFWPDTDNAVLMELKSDPEENPWMEDYTNVKMYEYDQTVYKDECDYDVSYNKVREIWSEGTFSFVNYAGHGSPTACYEYYPQQAFVDTDTCTYLDDNYPSIIFAAACSNSYTGQDNIGQMMLKQGAVGFLGATEVAYGFHGWNDPYDGATASLDYFFFTKCTSGDYTQGAAHQWGLLEMYTHDLWYDNYLETFEWGALWGNPDLTMGIVSQPPDIPDDPIGPRYWTMDVEVEFKTYSSDPDGDSIQYMFDWGDGSFSDWEGPFPSGQEGKASHIWSELGDYQIKVKARDTNGVESDWSGEVTLSILENSQPEDPVISGPKNVKAKRLYTYSFIANDPEGHDVNFLIRFESSDTPTWEGPFSSGEEVTFSHAWNSEGKHSIVAKAMDIYGAKSGQTSYTVTVTKSKSFYNPSVLRILEDLFSNFPIFERFFQTLT